jgi:hypothetical protein
MIMESEEKRCVAGNYSDQKEQERILNKRIV